MHISKFKFLAEFGGELSKEQAQKIRKNNQRTTFLELWGSATGLLLNVHIKFQLHSSIGCGKIGQELPFLKVKGEGNPHIFLSNWSGRLIFGYFVQLWFSIDWVKKEQFLRFWPLSTSFAKLEHKWIFTQGHLHLYTANLPPNWAEWPNWNDFGEYQA